MFTKVKDGFGAYETTYNTLPARFVVRASNDKKHYIDVDIERGAPYLTSFEWSFIDERDKREDALNLLFDLGIDRQSFIKAEFDMVFDIIRFITGNAPIIRLS